MTRKRTKDKALKQTAEELTELRKLVKSIEKRERKRKRGRNSLPVWLAAIGTLLSGLGAIGTHLKPSSPPPPPPQPIVEGAEKPNQGTRNLLRREKPAGSPPDFGDFIASLSESTTRRYAVAEVLRADPDVVVVGVSPPWFKWKTNVDEAKLTLFSVDMDESMRAFAALYLGVHGNRDQEKELREVAREDSVAGEAAAVAIQMLFEAEA